MFRTFIQCAGFLQAVMSAVFLIKAGLSISVKDMAELAVTKGGYSAPVLRNLVKQKADTRIGFSLLMSSVSFQSLHWLLPFGIDDLGIDRIGVITAFAFATAVWFIACRFSRDLEGFWYIQAEDILGKRLEPTKKESSKNEV